MAIYQWTPESHSFLSLCKILKCILQLTFSVPCCVSNSGWTSPHGAPYQQIHFETTIYFQLVAKYLPLKSPINVLLVVVGFFFCLFPFLTFITSLEAFVARRHSSGTKMLLPRRPVDIRGTPLIYNLTTAQPMRGYAWHIVKNSCISWWDKLLLTCMLW